MGDGAVLFPERDFGEYDRSVVTAASGGGAGRRMLTKRWVAQTERLAEQGAGKRPTEAGEQEAGGGARRRVHTGRRGTGGSRGRTIKQ